MIIDCHAPGWKPSPKIQVFVDNVPVKLCWYVDTDENIARTYDVLGDGKIYTRFELEKSGRWDDATMESQGYERASYQVAYRTIHGAVEVVGFRGGPDPYYLPSFYVDKPYRPGLKSYFAFHWMNLKICNPWWSRSVFIGMANPEAEPMTYSGKGLLRVNHDSLGPVYKGTGFNTCTRCGAVHPHDRRCLWIWQYVWRMIWHA